MDLDITPTDLNVPTWLWYGDCDQAVPALHGRWLAEHIPVATLITRPGNGHSGTLFGFWDDMFTTLSDEIGQDARSS